MKRSIPLSQLTGFICIVALAGGVGVSAAMQDADDRFPTAQSEHEWLKSFIGEWDVTIEVWLDPDAEPDRATGRETVRAIGDFWIVADLDTTLMGSPVTRAFTIGYDPGKEKYIAMWVDSVSSVMWLYEGERDEAARTLTLRTEGAMRPGGEVVKYKAVTEFKSDDHRTYTSNVQLPDGSCEVLAILDYQRIK